MLSNNTIQEMLKLSRLFAPKEMCGLLFAPSDFWMCTNASKDPEREFVLDHAEYVDVCGITNATPWAIVHSHPGKGAAPSVADCHLMDALQIANQNMAMVIVGLEPVEIRCFKKVGELYHLEWSHTMYDADRREFLCSALCELQ